MLGAVLLSDRVHYAFVIEEGLRPSDFYRERHRIIYESMLDLYTESEPIDVLTVTEHLRSRGKLEEAGGAAEIDALTGAVPAVGNLRRYGSIVKEHSLLRRVLNATYEIQASVHGHDAAPREIVERAEKLDARGRPRRPSRRTSAASARSCTRRSTSGSSSPSRAARSPAPPRASPTSTRSRAASSRAT